jgi:NAD(P)-dependent dehydrogenase (short-subunit alcohol dehydrogenase family)
MGVHGHDEESLAVVADGLAMGRHVEAVEVARMITFLAADGCPSLTGSTLDINGASYIR